MNSNLFFYGLSLTFERFPSVPLVSQVNYVLFEEDAAGLFKTPEPA